MSEKGRLARGEKQLKELGRLERKGKKNKLEWMKSQPTVMADIEFYKKSLEKPKEEKPQVPKVKGKGGK